MTNRNSKRLPFPVLLAFAFAISSCSASYSPSFEGLPSLAFLKSKESSAVAAISLLGIDTFQRWAGAQEQGDTLLLNPAEGDMGWATYKLTPYSNIELRSVAVDLDEGQTSECWVALANFTLSRWDTFGPYSADALIDISANGSDYISGLGNLYISVVANGGEKAAIESVSIALENFMHTWGTDNDEWGERIVVDQATGDAFICANDFTSNDCLLLKYNAAGELQWVKQFDATDNIRAIDVMLFGGDVLLLGYVDQSNDLQAGYLARLDIDGNLLWAKSYRTSGGRAHFERMSNDGTSLFLCGNAVITTGDRMSPVVARIDPSNGNLSWGNIYHANYAGASVDYGNAIAATSTSGAIISTEGSGFDYCVFKVDALGDLAWADIMTGVSGAAYNLSIDSSGVWIFGDTFNDLTFLKLNESDGSFVSGSRFQSDFDYQFGVPWSEPSPPFAVIGSSPNSHALVGFVDPDASTTYQYQSLVESDLASSGIRAADALNSDTLLGTGIAFNAQATGWNPGSEVTSTPVSRTVYDPDFSIEAWTPQVTDLSLNITSPLGVEDSGSAFDGDYDVAFFRYSR